MIVKTDRMPRLAWALEHKRTKTIDTSTICGSQQEAETLLVGYLKHLPHHGKFVVVPVMLTLEKGD